MYKIGYIDGLKTADTEPNIETLCHDANETPEENSKDTKGEWWNIDYVSDDFDVSGSFGWETD